MLAIIDYGSGNLRSVAKAFERVTEGKVRVEVTHAPETLKKASQIVLPGVGAFADCMNGLKALPGMLDALEEEVLQRGKYFLGICVGMQMLFEKGHEHGVHDGLGWLKGEVVPLLPSPSGRGKGEGRSQVGNSPHPDLLPEGEGVLKIPHMGWNDLTVAKPHPALKTGDEVYFVHSYHAQCRDAQDVLATTDYGQTVTAAVQKNNILGTQFHPEKSQATGLRLLKYFIELP